MKKGQQLEATITKVDFPNKGKCTIEDRDITIKGTIEGQKVRFQVQKLRKGKAVGRLFEVVEYYPSIVIYCFSSTFFASFLGTNSFKVPSSNLALISS